MDNLSESNDSMQDLVNEIEQELEDQVEQEIADSVLNAEERINESERQISDNEERLEILEDEINQLHTSLADESITMDSFVDELSLRKRQIGQIRVDLIRDTLSKQAFSKLQAEMINVMKEAETFYKKNGDVRNKRITATVLDTRIENAMRDLLKKYKVREEETSRAHSRVNVPEGKQIHSSEVGFFMFRDPLSETELVLVYTYLYYRVSIMDIVDALSVFGSESNFREVLKSIADRTLGLDEMREYYKQIYTRDINSILTNTEEKEYVKMFQNAKRFSNIASERIEDDQQKLLETSLTLHEKDRILKRYNKYIPITGMDPYLLKGRFLKSIRKPKKLDLGLKELRPFVSTYEVFMKNYMDINGKLRTDLIQLLSKFPPKHLLKCVKTFMKDKNTKYIRRLYYGARIPVLKFRTTPEKTSQMYKELKRGVDELHLSRDILKQFSEQTIQSQIVMVHYKLKEGSRFLHDIENIPLPSKTRDVDSDMVANFFNNMENYGAELVYPVTNKLATEIQQTYSSEDETLRNVLHRMRPWSFAILKGRALQDLLMDLQQSSATTRMKYPLHGGKNAMSIQKVPVDEAMRKSVLVLDDTYRIMVEEPPINVNYGWLLVVQKGDEKVPIIVPSFREYLEGLKNIMLQNMRSNPRPSLYREFKEKILLIKAYLKDESPVAFPPLFSKENEYRKNGLFKLITDLPLEHFSPRIDRETFDQLLHRLEAFCASTVKSVDEELHVYNLRIDELRFILMSHPDIPFRMLTQNMLPSEVMNIRTEMDYRTVIEEQNVQGIEDLLAWMPDHTLLDKHPRLYAILDTELKQTESNPDTSVLTPNKLPNVPPYVQRMIITEAYEYMKWKVAIKRARDMVSNGKRSGVDEKTIRDKVYSYLMSERYKLPSQKIAKTLTNEERIYFVDRIKLKIKACTRARQIETTMGRWVLSTYIESALYNLAGKDQEYKEFSRALLQLDTEAFCGILFDTNGTISSGKRVVERLVDKIVRTGMVARGRSFDEFISNSSIQVLKTLHKLQIQTLDWVSDLTPETQQRTLNEIQRTEVEIIERTESEVASSEIVQNTGRKVSSSTMYRIRDIYIPGKYVKKLPHTLYTKSTGILPLPERRGFIVGGKFPLNPKAYRKIDDNGSYVSELGPLLYRFGKTVNVRLDSLTQEITDEEKRAIAYLTDVLDTQFRLKPFKAYTKEEILKICDASGYTVLEPFEYVYYGPDEKANLQTMFQRCIEHQVEKAKKVEASQVGKRLLSLKEYKQKLRADGVKLTDKEIVKLYFSYYKVQNNIRKPFLQIHDKVYRVYKHQSTEFPVPFEYVPSTAPNASKFPVYLKNQLEDLALLLEHGYLSPWLVNKVKPLYSTDLKKVVGFSGNPPWQIKEENIEYMIKKIENDDIPEGYLAQFYNEDELSPENVEKILEKRLQISRRIHQRCDHLTPLQKTEIAIKFRFTDPAYLKQRITENYSPYFNTLRYIESDTYDKLSAPEKQKVSLSIRESFPMYKSSPLKSIREVVGRIQEDFHKLEHMNRNDIEAYMAIARKYGIESENILFQFRPKLVQYIRNLEKTIAHIRGLETSSTLSQHDIRSSLLNIVHVYGISVPSVSKSELIHQLRRQQTNIGFMSFYYIEQTFVDKYGKEFVVRNGVPKSKLFYKPMHWNPDTRQIDININDLTETSEQRALRLLEKFEKIEDIPVYKISEKALIDKKKIRESVWEWYPIKEPSMKREKELWQKNPVIKEWKRLVTKELAYLRKLIYNRVRSTSLSFQRAKDEATKRLEFERVKLLAQGPLRTRSTFGGKAVPFKSSKVPDDVFALEMLDYMLQNQVIILTKKARTLIEKFRKRETKWAKRYVKYSVVHRDNSFVEFRNFNVRILDILKNMSYTHELQLVKEVVDPIPVSAYGELYDYLVAHVRRKVVRKLTNTELLDTVSHNLQVGNWSDDSDTNLPTVSSKLSYTEKFRPKKPVIIDEKDVFDYLGDSYMQFAVYKYGMNFKPLENDTQTRFLSFPCKYQDFASSDNKYLTFGENGEFQNVYVIDKHLHRKGSISSAVARRLAFVLDVDLGDVPPCYSTPKNEREEREHTYAITSEDVKQFFIGAPSTPYKTYIEEKIKENPSMLKVKERQEKVSKLYRDILFDYIENPSTLDLRHPNVHMQLLKQLAVVVDTQPTKQMKKVYVESIDIPRIVPGAVIDKFVISNTGTPEIIENKIRDKIIQFQNAVKIELDESYFDLSLSRVRRPIRIREWVKQYDDE